MDVVRAGGAVVTASNDQVAPARGIGVTGLGYGVDVRDELRAHMKYIVPGNLALAIEKV